MDDAISRSAVHIVINSQIFDTEYPSELDELERQIDELPALDVVPVVRCKDCVHAAPLEGYASRKFEIGLNCRACRGGSGYGIAGLSFTVPDGYCDDGLRRAGESHD